MSSQFEIATFGDALGTDHLPDPETWGGKGSGLISMSMLGAPVPPGIVIPSQACVSFLNSTPSAQTAIVRNYAEAALDKLGELATDDAHPLLSVRSGARVSMPGMMDTVLNVGLTRKTLEVYEELLGERGALDSFRRLIEMYTNVVHSAPDGIYQDALSGEFLNWDWGSLTTEEIRSRVAAYLDKYEEWVGLFPSTRFDQVEACIRAVFNSWNSPRAKAYRKTNNIPNDWGTAVVIQTMVFGNLNNDSGSGVYFTRNPTTGEPGLYGEFLRNAQGEDVVAGIRTPRPISDMETLDGSVWPAMYKRLTLLGEKLESHYKDMQDIEFTVESGKLYILQTRTGKRSAKAAFRIAHDLVEEGTIEKADAVSRVSAAQYMTLEKPVIDPDFSTEPNFTGIPASGGIVSGEAVFSSDAAKKSKVPCILVTEETTPNDFEGMAASVGILTRTGGTTSHAAVVTRGMDKTCVVGCTDLKINHDFGEGAKITLDGETGRVWVAVDVPVLDPEVSEEAKTVLSWALGTTSDSFPVLVELETTESYAPGQWETDFCNQLPESGEATISLRRIGNRAKAKFSKLLDVLMSRPDLRGIIDLKGIEVSDADKGFLTHLLDDPSELLPARLEHEDMLAVLSLGKCSKALMNSWSLDLPGGLTNFDLSTIKDLGWKPVSRITTLGQLIRAEGPLVITPDLTQSLLEDDVEVSEIIELIKNSGRDVTFAKDAKTNAQVVFEALGK